MKKLLIIIFTILSSNISGQEQVERNPNHSSSLFVEFGGNAPLISLNYDYLIQTRKENLKYSFTLGATHHFNEPADFVVAPQVNGLIGRNLMAELGIGLTIPFSYLDDWVWIPRFGGRYQKMDGGMFYRIAFTPIVSSHSKASILPMFGISLGYTFKCSKRN